MYFRRSDIKPFDQTCGGVWTKAAYLHVNVTLPRNLSNQPSSQSKILCEDHWSNCL